MSNPRELIGMQGLQNLCVPIIILREKTTWGMIPYVQSLLLARTIRGDLDGYPPFLWK